MVNNVIKIDGKDIEYSDNSFRLQVTYHESYSLQDVVNILTTHGVTFRDGPVDAVRHSEYYKIRQEKP
jgi:hypothetical protein